MYRVEAGVKGDPARRWALPDRVFFACGACHVLASAFLERHAGADKELGVVVLVVADRGDEHGHGARERLHERVRASVGDEHRAPLQCLDLGHVRHGQHPLGQRAQVEVARGQQQRRAAAATRLDDGSKHPRLMPDLAP